jgi:hypothetical protein
MDLKKKIINLNDGLNVYNQLLKDEENILIPFAISLYVTVSRINELLPEYLADLEHNECKESLCIDFNLMTSVDYWMEKLVKLKNDMEHLASVPMKVHGFVVTILGFSPETTMDLYRAIEREIMRMVEMLKEVEEGVMNAPVTLYGSLYCHLRAQYCEKQAVSDFKNWLRSSGIPSLDKFKTFRAEEIIRFLKGETLASASEPSVEEWEKVDVEWFKKQVPLSYQEEEWFKKHFDRLFVIFCRTVSWQGDVLVPDYNCAGLFIFQHWDSLTEKDIQAIFYLDKTLELIHEEIVHLPEFSQDSTLSARDGDTAATAPALPEALATPEAMALWQKAQKAGYVDEHYQPLISRPEAAVLAFEMAKRLDIEDKWKAFEMLWDRRNMYRDYYTAINQKKSLKFRDEVKAALG